MTSCGKTMQYILTSGAVPQKSEWDAAREEYENLIEQPDAKELLVKICKESISTIDDNLFPKKEPESGDPSINVFHDGTTYTFEGPFTIGRHNWNDIFLNNPSISRCHLVVIPVYERAIVIIADFASSWGTMMKARSSDKGCLASTKNEKNLLIIDWDEAVEVVLSPERGKEVLRSEKIVMGPKMCVVCFDKARTKAFQCNGTGGHLVACEDCIGGLDKCPLCRKQGMVKTVGNLMQTNVVAFPPVPLVPFPSAPNVVPFPSAHQSPN